jgi:hypothetical protein
LELDKKLMFLSIGTYWLTPTIILSLILLSLFAIPKMAFGVISFPILQIEDKMQLVRADQSRGSVTVQTITSGGGGSLCEQCKFIVYKPVSSANVVLAFTSQTPFDLTAAKRVVFFAKGELGGETIKAAAIGRPSNLVPKPPITEFTFGVVSPNIVLTNEWKRYELSVDKLDLKDITSPFGLMISNQRGSTPIFPGPASDKPPLNNRDPEDISIYIKGISVDDKSAANPMNSSPQLTTIQRAANDSSIVPFPFMPFRP